MNIAKNKAMIGGCCVCSDEEGSANNPIVYCDGKDCNIAVHKGCYGIKKIPEDAWFCRRCESMDRSARVKCELCPIRDGAMKRTTSGGWCHVLCALYIPEADFIDMYTMEPITLERIPAERLGKVCFLCDEGNRRDASTRGACVRCNETGCKVTFHAACGHIDGLLIEERSPRSKLINYVGYCPRHFNKALLPETQKLRNVVLRPLLAFTHPKSSSVILTSSPSLSNPDSPQTVPPLKLSLLQSRRSSVSSTGFGLNTSQHKRSPSPLHTPSVDHSTPLKPPLLHPMSERDINSAMNTPTDVFNTGSHQDLDPPHLNSNDHLDVKPNIGYNGSTNKRNSQENKKKNNTTTIKLEKSSKPKMQTNRKRNSGGKLHDSTTGKKQRSNNSWTGYDPDSTLTYNYRDNQTMYQGGESVTSSKPTMGPTRPRPISDLHLLPTSEPSRSTEGGLMAGAGISMRSMEDLLEWQWDQGGLLLMQQSHNSDIVTLLTCLNELKTENDQLESKALRLARKRDHLLYVNAKLTSTLNITTNHSTAPPSATHPPARDSRTTAPNPSPSSQSDLKQSTKPAQIQHQRPHQSQSLTIATNSAVVNRPQPSPQHLATNSTVVNRPQPSPQHLATNSTVVNRPQPSPQHHLATNSTVVNRPQPSPQHLATNSTVVNFPQPSPQHLATNSTVVNRPQPSPQHHLATTQPSPNLSSISHSNNISSLMANQSPLNNASLSNNSVNYIKVNVGQGNGASYLYSNGEATNGAVSGLLALSQVAETVQNQMLTNGNMFTSGPSNKQDSRFVTSSSSGLNLQSPSSLQASTT